MDTRVENEPVSASLVGTEDDGSAPAGRLQPSQLWDQAVEVLRSELPEGHFAAWFGRATPVTMEGSSFVLAVPSIFVKEWIEARYLPLMRAVLSRFVGREMSVLLVADESLPDTDAASEIELPPEAAEVNREVVLDAPPLDDRPDFHPRYNFESFVIGSSNRFAHAAALAVAEAPAEAYNPLFIYGEAGLGKTHLLHAIGRYVRDCHRNLVVRYVSTEQFMNDFILALQRRTIPNFHRRYRVADLLLVDDIQFLEGKERTQEEFFHTFNALHPKSQIVITSDRPPKKIPTLEERLRTRFEWGLITDIQPPDLETRLAILQMKSETEHLSVPGDVMSYIAEKIQTNIRELEGALIRVAAYASLTRSEVTLELAQGVLQSLLPNTSEARVTSDLIISVTSSYFDVTHDEICSASRSRPLVNARQMAMYLCRELTDLSLPKIGERFGGRDHSTVVFAVNKVKHQMKERETWYEQVRELTTRIRQQAARG
ncbi:MAG TPA: chromosomal replication initiator protein DnaA [Actinomycetota bacterium]|nr:chromosomal replication initiator protein DnaA [Actinomycetota bacterium]